MLTAYSSVLKPPGACNLAPPSAILPAASLVAKRSVQVAPQRMRSQLSLMRQDMHKVFYYFLDRTVEQRFQTYYRNEKQSYLPVYMGCLLGIAIAWSVEGAQQQVFTLVAGFLNTFSSTSNGIIEVKSAAWLDDTVFFVIMTLFYLIAACCALYLWRRRGEYRFAIVRLDPVQLVLLFYGQLVFIPVTLITIANMETQLLYVDKMKDSVGLLENNKVVQFVSSTFLVMFYFFLLVFTSIFACLLRLQFWYLAVFATEFTILVSVLSSVYAQQVACHGVLEVTVVVILLLLLRGVWEDECSCRREFLNSCNLVSENRRLSNQNIEMKEELSGKLQYQMHYEMSDILRILCQIKVKMNATEKKDIDKIITALVTNEDLFGVSLDPTMAEHEEEVQGWLHMMAFKEPSPNMYRVSASRPSSASPPPSRRQSRTSQVLQKANSRRLSGAESEVKYASEMLNKYFFLNHDLQEDQEDLSGWLFDRICNYFYIDMFYIEKRCSAPLQVVLITCVEVNNFVSRLSINMDKLTGFAGAVENHYFKRNPYHNCLHAAAVVADMNFYLRRLNLDVDDTTFFVGLIAAAAHDISHPGVSNGFLIATRSKLAITYSDDSVLERMHVAELYRILSHDKFDIFSHMTVHVRMEIRKLIIQMILATDLSKHFPHISKLKSKKFAVSEETRGLEVGLIMETLVMMADLGHTVKPFPYHQLWANRISEEFFRQGDAEERQNLPVSPLCDRRNANLPKSQVTFLTLLAMPLFETAGQAFAIDEYDSVMSTLQTNIRMWQEMIGGETASNGSNKAVKRKEK